MTEVKKVGSGLDASSNKRPTNWVTPTLGEVYTVVGGGTPSTEKADYWGTGTPWVTSADIYGVRDIKPRKQATTKGIENSTTQVVPRKTLLVVTRVGLGKIAITETDTCFSQDVQGLIQRSNFIAPEFSLYFLSYELQILKHQSRGTTISGITKKQLTDLEFPLPPYKEQLCIVAKIEELFSEVDKGVENLRTAQQQLKVYRQALLKQAFEGKLTADWRAQNPDKLESTDALLARIQQKREARYQQQLQEWRKAQQTWEASGKAGSKPSKPKTPGILSRRTTEELAGLAELPKGWAWQSIEPLLSFEKKPMTTGPFGTLLSKPDYRSSGLPVLGIENIGDGVFIKGNKIFVSEEKALELSSFAVEPGDLIISRSGTVGEICKVPDHIGVAYISTNLIRITLDKETIDPDYFVFLFQGGAVKQLVKDLCKGSSRAFLNQTILSAISFPIPCLEEQRMIVNSIEEKFSIIDQLEQTITHSLQQAGALRQSILKKAFSGQLVAQDPSDEPASVLLERIRAERAAQPTARGRKAKASA